LHKFFANRVDNMWNSLPNSAVHAESTDIFKKPLDKFWSNQEVIYNYYAEIQETGSRSVISIKETGKEATRVRQRLRLFRQHRWLR